jgi:tetratricopeptide (TPR) repeat protein
VITDDNESQAERAFAVGLEGLKEDNYPKALSSFRAAIALKPRYPQAWEQLAIVLQWLKDDEVAEQALIQAKDIDIPSKEFWYTLANALHKDKAQEAYRRALAIDPDYEQALHELAWSLRVSEKKDEALDVYRKLLDLYIKRRDSRALNALGDTLRRLVGAFDDAEQALNRALEFDPQLFSAWKNFSYLLCNRKDPIGAQKVIREFIQRFPEHHRKADAWVCLGNILRSVNDLKGAEEAVRIAIKVDPRRQAAWSKLSDILFELGNLEGGEEALERANELDCNKKYDDACDDIDQKTWDL